jgi:uncharacterized membrane protein YhhN
MPHSRAVATTAYAVLAAADTLLAGSPDHRRLRLLTKPLLMPALAATLVTADRDDPAVRRTLAAQALCWGGDVALMGTGRRPFLAGLASFLAAHVGYVTAFRSRSSTALLSTTGGRAALTAGAVLAPTMALAARRSDPRLAGPVAAYGLVLATMVAASAAVPAERGGRRILMGTTLFLLSDTLLAVRKFVLDEPSATMESAVMATYTAGQWFISEGMAASTP